jgi:hypothetical protein
MKTLPKIPTPASNACFTFVETMIASTILVLVVGAMVTVQIFGLRVYTLAETKLSATASARDTLDKIRYQIQSANGMLDVGNYTWSSGSPTNFALIASGQNQVGNALRIIPSATTNFVATSSYTLIFLQPGNGGTNYAVTDANGNNINTNLLLMETFDGNLNPLITNTLATYITNQNVFTATDFTGTNILTSNANNRVIQITLFFSQWEYPIAIIGTNDINAYNYYRLQTRVTRRAISD